MQKVVDCVVLWVFRLYHFIVVQSHSDVMIPGGETYNVLQIFNYVQTQPLPVQAKIRVLTSFFFTTRTFGCLCSNMIQSLPTPATIRWHSYELDVVGFKGRARAIFQYLANTTSTLFPDTKWSSHSDENVTTLHAACKVWKLNYQNCAFPDPNGGAWFSEITVFFCSAEIFEVCFVKVSSHIPL